MNTAYNCRTDRASMFKREPDYQSQPRDTIFRGVQITEHLYLRRVADSAIFLSVILVLITTIARVLCGSLDIAFAAGSLFVTWVSLILGVACYSSVR